MKMSNKGWLLFPFFPEVLQFMMMLLSPCGHRHDTFGNRCQ